MKTALKVIFAFCFYKVQFLDPQDWKNKLSGETKIKWGFKFKPRTWAIILFMIVLSPLLILLVGTWGLRSIFSDFNRTHHFSSYRLLLNANELPSKLQAYKLF